MFGAIIRGYLPQRWRIDVEGEVYSVVVDASGTCSVEPGSVGPPDVSIVVGHDRLKAALERRDPRGAPPGPYAVTFQTAKGATAYQFLRSRLGL
jgi:hypothetical protein